ncbi:helix-turn-helix domain-containing protein [Actinomadura sp. DSM 109109]|nr:helix-turn-helix domain-containing protein [Actinomadura lepetitiana]
MAKQSRPPTARLRRLASELLALRQDAGLTREAITERTGINQVTLYRIESARARPQARTLKALLDLYDVEQKKREALVLLLREAGQPHWLQPYQEGLSEQYNAFIGFEAEARSLRNYQMSFVPGLLQTENYARAIIRGVLPQATSEEVEQRVEARLHRQALLDAEGAPSLWAIVDEAALRRQVGSSQTMRAQVARLREVMDRPQVTLQVLPLDAGPHPAMFGAFVILTFQEPVTSDIVYIEGLTGDLFLDDALRIERYSGTFDHLRALAASPASTRKLLDSVVKDA